jgi:hypothetical protein
MERRLPSAIPPTLLGLYRSIGTGRRNLLDVDGYASFPWTRVA